MAALAGLSPEARGAWGDATSMLQATGAQLLEIDLAPFLAAGRLLYEGAFVAERYAAVGDFIAAHPLDVDETVARIILGGGSIAASQYVADRTRLDELRLAAMRELGDADVLVVPTAPAQPTIAAVAADPIGENARLGTYATFCNMVDLCAVAVPAGEADGGRFGVTVMAPAFHDRIVADVARRLAAGV
jgi:allophanate hydrolase